MKLENAAVKKLKQILKEAGKSGFLRVFMSEGCCGPSVAMDLIEKPAKDDLEITNGDFKVYIDKAAAALLENAALDCDPDGEIIIKGLPAPEGGCGGGCSCGH